MQVTLSKDFKMPDGTFVKTITLKEPSCDLILNEGLPRSIEMKMEGEKLSAMKPVVDQALLKKYICQMTGLGENLLFIMPWQDLVALKEAVLDFLQPLGTSEESAKPSSSI